MIFIMQIMIIGSLRKKNPRKEIQIFTLNQEMMEALFFLSPNVNEDIKSTKLKFCIRYSF